MLEKEIEIKHRESETPRFIVTTPTPSMPFSASRNFTKQSLQHRDQILQPFHKANLSLQRSIVEIQEKNDLLDD